MKRKSDLNAIRRHFNKTKMKIGGGKLFFPQQYIKFEITNNNNNNTRTQFIYDQTFHEHFFHSFNSSPIISQFILKLQVESYFHSFAYAFQTD